MMEEKVKKKIGVIGEHPNNDAAALVAILQKYLSSEFDLEIFPIKNIRGGALDNVTALQTDILIELDNYHYIILLRDLDGLASDKQKIKDKEKWFEKINRVTGGEMALFFLVIYELESLMLCDIETLNRFYQVDIQLDKAPIFIKETKELLKQQTRKSSHKMYDPSDSLLIFQQLDFNKLYLNHQGKKHSFQAFSAHLKSLDVIDF